MDSEDTNFSEKVYTWRNRKTLKKDVSSANATANVTKVSETLAAKLPVMVVLQTDQNHLITNFTSGDVPKGGVKLREAGSCSGGEVTFQMDSEDTCFFGKVYTRRNRKTLKKDVSTAIVTVNVTKVSETLDADLPVMLVPQTNQNHLITKGGVELREVGSCSGVAVVTISLNESKSIGEI
ncbi:hypothetical protein MTR67_041569 [Solanum verrucosum]|uniref:Uncharacterized protein n=1 Tax=Solanum verrucosum TaxID=315347 RepID=A0AAF0ZT93_SOLVR|nr:hypothetical protein MTR67_041569 [Solanum verrucosum]